MTGPSDSVVELMPPRLWCRRGAAPTMTRAHRHDDLELNVVLSGELHYLFGGAARRLAAGQLALFWAATPHRLIENDAHPTADVCWIHVPLSTVLGWRLPDADLTRLLHHQPVVVPSFAAGTDLADRFDRWRADLDGTGEEVDIALLEAHALVRRVLHHHRGSDPTGPSSTTADETAQRVTVMAQFLVTHFREPVGVGDLARAVHLHPNYAMTVFSAAMGVTVGQYLAQCRIAEAQRLLITTSMTTAEIAHAAGFGSQSSFYATFGKVCGRSPGAYRDELVHP